jgi:hypothetical protein
MNVLAVDSGGTSVTILATGQTEPGRERSPHDRATKRKGART